MQHNKAQILWILILLAMTAVFALDTQYSPEATISVLYIGVTALSIRLPNTRDISMVALVCSIATIVSFHFAPAPTKPWHALLNTILTLIALWVVTSMLLYRKELSTTIMRTKIKQKAMLDLSLDPILSVNNQGIITMASKSTSKVLGWQPHELIGKSIVKILDEPIKSRFQYFCEHADGLIGAPFIGKKQEIVAKNKAGQNIDCEFSITKIDFHAQDEILLMIIIQNISDRKKAENKLVWLSTHDELTGIYNRRYFNEQIDLEWRRLIRATQPLSLLLIDIDHFKAYNDALGHQAGDDCLVDITFIINAQFNRAGEFVARYGGEEFAILLPNTDRNGCRVICERILQAVRDQAIPHPHASAGDRVTVSIGAASITPTPTLNAEALIKMADSALYDAKHKGRDCFIIQGENCQDFDSQKSML